MRPSPFELIPPFFVTRFCYPYHPGWPHFQIPMGISVQPVAAGRTCGPDCLGVRKWPSLRKNRGSAKLGGIQRWESTLIPTKCDQTYKCSRCETSTMRSEGYRRVNVVGWLALGFTFTFLTLTFLIDRQPWLAAGN